MIYEKTEGYSNCGKCGIRLDNRYIVIGNNYLKAIPLIRKQSVKEISVLCVDCGMHYVTDYFRSLNCPVWIGQPATNDKTSAINFKGEIVRR